MKLDLSKGLNPPKTPTMKINQNGQSDEWCGTHTRFNVHDNPLLEEIQDNFDEVIQRTDDFIADLQNTLQPLPDECLLNGQRVTREEWELHEAMCPNIMSVWDLPESDLVLNFTDHLFYPECGLCHRQCEKEWGNNGAPLTDERICNECNHRVIHNRIMMCVDRIGPNNGIEEDEPDEPE